MKKLNKILASTMAVPALIAIAPALTITSCADKKPHLSFEGSKTIELKSGETSFTLTFDSKQRLRSTDIIETEVTVTDLDAAKGSTVTLTFDAEESSKNDGQFAIFDCHIGKEDGSVPEDDTVVKFNVKFNFKTDIDRTTWSESIEGFEVDYSHPSECDIELAKGQEVMYTQPGLTSQYYEFNLNHTSIPENAGIGAEVTVIDTQGNVSSVSMGPEGRDIDFSYQEGNKLYVWFRLVYHDKLEVDDNATFTIRLFCWDKTTKSVIWQKGFEQVLTLKFLGKEVAVKESERIRTKADNDAGSLSRTYKIFHDPELSDEYMPMPGVDTITAYNITEGSGITNISPVWECNVGGKEAGMPYWELTLNFVGDAVENDTPFECNILLNKESKSNRVISEDLGRFNFYYVGQKIEYDDNPQSVRTPFNFNYGKFNATLTDNADVKDTDYIRFECTPVDPNNDVYTRYYHQNVEKSGKSITSLIELVKKEGKLEQWDSASFYLTYVCFNKNNEKIWSQTVRTNDGSKLKHTLTKYDTPIIINSDKLQYVYSNPKGEFGADYNFKLTTLSEKETISVKLNATGSTEGVKLTDDTPQITYGMDKKIGFRASIADGAKFKAGDFIEFKATFASTGIPGCEWEYTIEGLRLEIGEGLTLDTKTTITWSAKEYKQTALKNAEPIGKTIIVPEGTTTTVTINTKDWPETLPTLYHWALAMPHEPNKDLFNCYFFEVKSILHIKSGGEEIWLQEGKEGGDYYVGSSGWININKKIGLELGDTLVYTLTLLNEDINKETNFYWTYENSY